MNQAELAALANRWEPEASALPPDFRRATCVVCAEPMHRMWHLWLKDGGFKKELHMCAGCGIDNGYDKTLIVVAALDDSFMDNLPTYTGGTVKRVMTSEGGHPSWAFINTYRAEPDYTSYLFIQDSMRGIAEDCVAPFRGRGPVVAWHMFPMSWDGPDQARWVRQQYPLTPDTDRGIFGPTFYATREAMERTEKFFPAYPHNKIEAQGTERAWAFAFAAAGVPVSYMYDFNPAGMGDGSCPPFTKVFAGRQ